MYYVYFTFHIPTTIGYILLNNTLHIMIYSIPYKLLNSNTIIIYTFIFFYNHHNAFYNYCNLIKIFSDYHNLTNISSDYHNLTNIFSDCHDLTKILIIFKLLYNYHNFKLSLKVIINLIIIIIMLNNFII